jgi:hypothetical protein
MALNTSTDKPSTSLVSDCMNDIGGQLFSPPQASISVASWAKTGGIQAALPTTKEAKTAHNFKGIFMSKIPWVI